MLKSCCYEEVIAPIVRTASPSGDWRKLTPLALDERVSRISASSSFRVAIKKRKNEGVRKMTCKMIRLVI